MRLTVCKPLNERIGAPSINSQSVNVKMPGETIEIVNIVWGDVLDGNGIWYVSDQGFYYWSGGFAEVNFVLEGCDINNYTGEAKAGILLQLQEAVHQQLKLKVNGYLGCGFGNKNYEDNHPFSMLIYVKHKLAENNPDLKCPIVKEIRFWGFKILTDVMESNLCELLGPMPVGSNPKLEKNYPYLVGGGILNSDETFKGTRFIKAKIKRDDNISDYFLLTCCHVVFPFLKTNFEYNRTNSKPATANFPLSDECMSHRIEKAVFNNDLDFAAILIDAPDIQNIIDGNVIDDYFGIEDINDLYQIEVVMVGFVSGIRRGKVKGVFKKCPLELDNGEFHEFNNVILTNNISVKGDSGAPVIAKLGNEYKLVGMVAAGNSDDTCILPFYCLADNKHKYSLK
ncbi:hypothetical protein DVR12_22875 [Chitinophaga silvatica]|uniref:Uncharacterized protein n=1 Tax=Chitinophaga silvatica TaxID=2282649 RepID=A0A3E1Y482_9BACT|nr:hypothetical protein [Chitinophaga silvatica]RFS19481.1 hypothetical protein DVR12_22875 [Chitinophaga silvatica]